MPDTIEVMHSLADCLRLLYQKAGLRIPELFDPAKEAERLACVLNGKHPYDEMPPKGEIEAWNDDEMPPKGEIEAWNDDEMPPKGEIEAWKDC